MNTNSLISNLHRKFLLFGSITLIGAFLVNLLNYFFTLVAGRLLGPGLFAEVATLSGFLLLVSVPSSAFTLYVAKEVAILRNEGRESHIGLLYRRSTFQALNVGLIALVIFALFIPFLSKFLAIEIPILLLFSLLIPASLLSSVNLGVFQGEEKFNWFSGIAVTSAAFKFIFAIITIKIGWGIAGVVGSLLVSSLIPYIWSSIYLTKRFVVNTVDEVINFGDAFSMKAFLSDYYPMFWGALCLSLLLNIDVILAKHYLDPLAAGHYAALSILGKIILYSSLALVNVMFPIVSGSRSAKGDTSVLRLVIGIITLISVAVIVVVQMFPMLWVRILFGPAYYPVLPYLLIVEISMYFLSLVNALVNYFLAIRSINVLYYLVIGVIIQIALLVFMPHSLEGMSHALLIGESLIIVFLAIYYFAVKDRSSTKI